MKVWIVNFFTGRHEDYSSTPMKVFASEKKANAFMRKLEKEMVKLGCHHEKSTYKSIGEYCDKHDKLFHNYVVDRVYGCGADVYGPVEFDEQLTQLSSV